MPGQRPKIGNAEIILIKPALVNVVLRILPIQPNSPAANQTLRQQNTWR
jgi:hypothetical protein